MQLGSVVDCLLAACEPHFRLPSAKRSWHLWGRSFATARFLPFQQQRVKGISNATSGFHPSQLPECSQTGAVPRSKDLTRNTVVTSQVGYMKFRSVYIYIYNAWQGRSLSQGWDEGAAVANPSIVDILVICRTEGQLSVRSTSRTWRSWIAA